ncbi:hypothetical protein LTR05_004703 [Lithohypha guttulata]|uniref:Uncharacterized protein n=1 Tax=Lithohypha guttulata TaxID=1690604 RepID=A0AAN7SYV1_9EURO|nr:hypothetical protein LTR05_004703 [Lithohypha guttulata]
MAIPRASATFGRTVLRRASAQTRSRAWRQIGRRQYASEHGGSSRSSELPWMIGSVGFTVPAAVWLYGQGPKKGSHGHEETHEESHGEGEEEGHEPNEDKEQHEAASDTKDADQPNSEKEYVGEGEPQQEEKQQAESDSDESKDASSDQGSDDSADEKTEQKDDSGKEEKQEAGDSEKKDDSKEDDKKADEKTSDDKKSDDKKSDDKPRLSEDGYELPGPNAPGQINYKSGTGKGPGEQQQQVGGRPQQETKGQKDSQSQQSGAQNPYLDDHEKGKKGEGLKETARIHGTVDSNRPLG